MDTQDGGRRSDRTGPEAGPVADSPDIAVLDRPVAVCREVEGRVRWCRPAVVDGGVDRGGGEATGQHRVVIVRGED
ncbi:hypothetical protein [Streptomyces sp. NPDC046887]|uniref:hypothetical protein n=1 Tax=Streptomyces sp. NPDC046887 TaxID=3155472 RepID=UPI0033D13D54